LNYDLIQELVALHQRIAANGGVMRLSGLSSLNEKLLRSRGLDGRSPSYRNRLNVLFGWYRPGQPGYGKPPRPTAFSNAKPTDIDQETD